MGGIEWVKLSTGFISSSTIKHIRAQKGGDTMVVLWLSLLCRAGIVNDRGRVYIAPGVPYTAVSLAAEFSMPRKVVGEALRLFEQLGMIRQDDEGLQICNWSKYQNIEGMERVRDGARLSAMPPEADPMARVRAGARERQQRYRDRKKVTLEDDGSNVTRNVTGDGNSVTRNVTDSADAVTRNGERNVTQDVELRDKEKDTVEVDYQKALDIDDEYRESTRARAKTASLIQQQIHAEKLLEGHLPKLFDAIEGGLARGFTVNGIMDEAHRCARVWGTFASALMSGEPR